MTKKTKKVKTRADSSHKKAEIVASTFKGIPVPPGCYVRDDDLVFWEYVTEARAEWTRIDLVHAANLASCLGDIERAKKKLNDEGLVILNSKDTPIVNPASSALEVLTRRAMSIASKIQVHAAATIGESKLSRGKNTAKRNAKTAQSGMDSLLMRPAP